ncbi:hypothetical protein V8F33_008595 [Rhypophila sp. PSN 637]
MPSARKRAFQDEGDSMLSQPATEPPSILHRLRNMWQFANLFQFMFLFGKPLKLRDDLDIDDLEAECLKPGSMVLQDIGLSLLKFLSSHRGLTHDLFDEYTRRQFVSKAPSKNPFGTDETPARFADFDVFQKIQVLQLMTQLVMLSSERLREKCEEQKDVEQTDWRIEPYGWDSKDREYYVLDDNRIYRLTEAPPPAPKPKKNSKKARAAQRASKRRRVSAAASDEEEAAEEEEQGPAAEPEDDGFGGRKWECIAVTLDEVRQFLSTIRKSKDENERVLHKQIEQHLVPILEKQEESRKRKQLQREKELLNLEKLAHAKRSSRIASKMEHQKVEEQARQEEQKRREEEAARRKAESRQAKIERERERRLVSREQRLKEREVRRLQHEEELAQLSGSGDAKSDGGRMSERQRQAEIEKNKEALKELEEEEEDWVFDCICGVYGQIDDGTHSVACEKCNVWQHSKCLGIEEKEAEADDFHFVCSTCRRREQAEKDHTPRIIKIKVKGHDSPSSSPPQKQTNIGSFSPSGGSRLVVDIPAKPPTASSEQLPLNGSGNDTRGDENTAPTKEADAKAAATDQPNGKSSEQGALSLSSPTLPPNASQNNPFSSPHPNLSPPGQSPNKSRAYETIFDQSSPAPAAAGPDIRQSPLEHSMNGALPVLSPPAGNGSGVSPSKHPQPLSSSPPTKTAQSPFPLSRESGGALPTRGLASTPSSSAILPPFSSQQGEAGAAANGDSVDRSTPLPPSRGGLSPTKHSPTLAQHNSFSHQVNGTPRSAIGSSAGGSHHAAGSLFPPPSAALSPSPQTQILTPPVKHAEPVRTPSQRPTSSEA